MAETYPPNPLSISVGLPDNNPHSLLALLQTWAALQSPPVVIPKNVCGMKIAYGATSDGYLYIGNSAVSTANFGDQLVGTQYHQEPMHDSNDIPLQDIYLLTDGTTFDELVGITLFFK